MSGSEPVPATTTDLVERITVADLSVLVGSAKQPGIRAVQYELGEIPAPGSRPPDLVIEIHDTPPAVPDRDPDQDDEMLDVWEMADRVVLADGYGRVAVVRGTSVHIGGPHHDDGGGRPLGVMLQSALALALRGTGRVLVHAGLLADPTGGALVLGGSGRGKSTLAGAALATGWRVMTDDLAVLTPTDGGYTAYGIGREIALPPEAVPPGLTGATPLRDDPRNRVTVPADDPARAAALRGLIIVGHDDGPGSVVDLTAAEIIKAVALGLPVIPLPEHVRWFLSHAAALATLPAVSIRHARAEANRLQIAAALLNDAWERITATADDGSPARSGE